MGWSGAGKSEESLRPGTPLCVFDNTLQIMCGYDI